MGSFLQHLQLTPLLIALITLCLFGFVLFLIGWRGRRGGDHPHCRKCGYDLYGSPAGTERCGECGADLTAPRARVIGQRRRDRIGMMIGALLVLLASIPLGLHAKRVAGEVDWIQYYPVSWLTKDFDGAIGPTRNAAAKELIRRIQSSELKGDDLNRFMDSLLTAHANPKGRWDNVSASVMGELLTRQLLDQLRLHRFLEGGTDLDLQTRQKIRKGSKQHASQRVSFRTSHLTLLGSFKTTPVQLAGKQVSSAVQHDRTIPNDPTHPNIAGGTMFFGMDFSSAEVAALPLGPAELSFKATFNLQAKEFPAMAPVQFEKTFSLPVEIVPADAVVDNFAADPGQREIVESYVKEMAVVRTQEAIVVQVRVAAPGMHLAMEVLARPAGADDSIAWQSLGELMVEPNSYDRWYTCESRNGAVRGMAGPLDVRLRPSQKAADQLTKAPAVIWGGEITRSGIAVREATPATDFVQDETLRPAVLSALEVTDIKPSVSFPGRLALSVRAGATPVTLNYTVIVRDGETEIVAGDFHASSSQGAQVAAGRGFGGVLYRMSAQLPDPTQVPARIDVILRPKPLYRGRDAADTQPWAGEIILRDLPVEKPPTTGPTR